ncbi:MAG: hypothetical protein U1E53_28250 [Dongiaceae bacterium]
MKPSRLLRAVVAVCALAALPALAAHKTEAVRFKAGTSAATLSGRIKGEDSIDYTLRAGAGQAMSVTFAPDNKSCYFNLYPPGGGSAAIHIGASAGNAFAGTLPAAGNYRAQVYLHRNAARRNETCTFQITFEITGAAAAPAKISDLGGMASAKAADTLAARGFRQVDSIASGQTTYGIYWNSRTRQCIQLTNADERVVDASDIHEHPNCRDEGAPAAVVSHVPAPDEQACLEAVSRETSNPDLKVLSTDTAEANNTVVIGVGPERAPWRCLVKNGEVAEVSFTGSDGGN